MKSKKLLILSGMMIALSVLILPGSARAAAKKKIFTYQQCKGGVTITDFDPTSKKLVIPDRLDGKKVVGIALKDTQDSFVTDLTIGRYVRSDVQDMGLHLMYELRKFHVSGQNKKFSAKDGVLYSKNGKRLLYYPQANKEKTFRVPAKVKSIETGAFQDTESLKTLYINKKLSHFGGMAYCAVERVIFPKQSKVTELLSESFYQMTALKEVVLPAHLERICDSAFSYCYKLKKLKIPGGINEIEAGAFTSCKGLRLIRPSYLKKQSNGSYYSVIRLNEKNEEVRKELIRDVKPEPRSLSISQKKTKKIKIKVKYGTKWYHTDASRLTFASSDKNVVTVNSKGKIRAKKKGSAVVKGTLVADGVFKIRIKVTVR